MGILSVILSLANAPGLPVSSQTKDFFAHSRSTPILFTAEQKSVSKRLLALAEKGDSSYAFISEDGSIAGMWLGTVEMFDTKTGETITTNDRFRLEFREKRMTAFNVSQETGIRKSFRGSFDIDLKPIVILDRYRTLCVSGSLSAEMVRTRKLPSRKLFLAVIDDRQRGANPNKVKVINIRDQIESSRISAIEFSAGRYTLKLVSQSGTRFLAVNAETLETQWIKAPRWSGFESESRLIHEKNPQLHISTRTRWDSKSYLLASAASNPEGIGLVWDGKVLRETGSQYMVAASINGRYAWLVDRKAGTHWVLDR